MQLTPADAAFPKGSLVLVTGANRYIASHIVDQVLLAGYRVRGTVRDATKAAWTTEVFTSRHGAGKYSAVVVPDMAEDGAFDDAVQDVQGIIHTASVLSFSPDPAAVIPSTIRGLTSILHSATTSPSVQSFVLTSSSVAAGNPTPDNQSFAVTTSTWNETAIAEAWSVTSPPFPDSAPGAVYCASKAEQEKALWAFVEKEKPAFRVNAVLPDANFGPAINPAGGLSTGGWISGLVGGGPVVGFLKTLPPGWYVNVVDTARIHVAALLSKSIHNERIYASVAPYTWNQILAILRNLYPKKEFVEDFPDAKVSGMEVPTERGAEVLRQYFGQAGYVSLEETVKQNVEKVV
ncbi:hypothetical protein V495_05571 [Pseudogymnoascus sp. VKM F-4514 (FW-929)]|nr:hypothetical protein V495_05571 [Pseudogymnoascus sp. VKM F-4514 (FW-929)]KFY55091.1 hypothetical protein V497_07206 [Pseudogymnoascus sp. VKM F-4516 (FW-969)]